MASYKKSAEGTFSAFQNDINIQRQAYNQAIAKLTEDINQHVDISVRQAQDQVQSECNRQLYDVNRQLQELLTRTNAEKSRLQAELQLQESNSGQRMNELIKNHRIELDRLRSELNAANAQTLNNLRRDLQGQISVAQQELEQTNRKIQQII